MAAPPRRAERAGACDEPLSAQPAPAVAISILSFVSPFLVEGARREHEIAGETVFEASG
ncbi:protein of unknown function (plasmid) [Methylocella tundrae]|uniref:Uncharacterized protein n=1 Tax=Methylocella tundrae TaxID=227605 RepID=A0A4U8Z717_METTU|nr:protein of unknown function [Methylocella tundrae]